MSGSERPLVPGAPVPSLVRWGCSPDGDLIYRTLVSFGAATVEELVYDVGLSRRRVRAALDELAAADAAVPEPTGKGRWAAASVAEVVATWQRNRRAARRGRVPGDAATVLHEALPLGPDMRHLATRAAARARLAELGRVVTHEHLAMNPESHFDPASARAGIPVDRAVLARGVRMRVLGCLPGQDDPLLRYGRRPDEPRPAYREAATVPMKLIVIDRRIALVPVDPANYEQGYLEIARPAMVSALASTFERHWADAHDPEEEQVPEVTLSARERTLIDLLAAGHTDAMAAEAMRISPRSVSAILRRVMDRLGADNRFQLGLALGARRAAVWPPPPAHSGPRERR